VCRDVVDYDHIVVKLIFPDEISHMQKLDQEILKDVTSEYLNEDVSVHIEKGSIGKSGSFCELLLSFLI
jgi:hypothetical protein